MVGWSGSQRRKLQPIRSPASATSRLSKRECIDVSPAGFRDWLLIDLECLIQNLGNELADPRSLRSPRARHIQHVNRVRSQEVGQDLRVYPGRDVDVRSPMLSGELRRLL